MRRILYHGHEGTVPLADTYLWPLLMGLHELDSGLLAHISLGACEREKRRRAIASQKDAWVQITSHPLQQNTRGIPILMTGRGEHKRPAILPLWIGSFGWLLGEQNAAYAQLSPSAKKKYWEDFFRLRLRETREKLLNEHRALVGKLRVINDQVSLLSY